MIQEATVKGTLISSIESVFETMLFMSIEENKTTELDTEGICTLGSISFKGDNIEGNLSMLCSRKDSKILATSMLGMDPEDELEESDVDDAIGEICNMLMGNIKADLVKDYGEFQICIPQVTTGSDMHNKLCGEGDSMAVDILVDDTLPLHLNMMCRV